MIISAADRDDRDAAGGIKGADAIGHHARAAQIFLQPVGVNVLAHAADHAHLAAQPGGGHGLIGSLAARGGGKPGAGQGFTQPGEAGGVNGEIHINAADDKNVLHDDDHSLRMAKAFLSLEMGTDFA